MSDVPDSTSTLVKALFAAIDGSKGVESTEQALDAQGLAFKGLFHASSCLSLYAGTVIPGANGPVLDSGSMDVLARATLESSLVFHYVFADPPESHVREFRHLSWVLGDLHQRQGFHVTMPASRQRLEDEALRIGEIRTRLKTNKEFQRLTGPKQKALLSKGKWRWKTWAEIARGAGLNTLHSDPLYRYLCSFAHSGSLSVLQCRQSKTHEEMRCLGEGALRIVNVALALMARGYCVAFPTAAAALAKDTQLAQAVDLWFALGSQE